MGEKPKRAWYPTVMILICIRFILYASISFRAVPKVLDTFFSEFVVLKDQPIPSHKTISRWLTRVGFYKLNLPKQHADDWAFILDNSIQVGIQKCLVILGARLSSLKWSSLSFADMDVLFIGIHEGNDKNFIFQALEKAQEKIGKAVMVCADDGPDLRSGIDLFCKKYDVGRVYDTIHKIGTFLKEILEKDPVWEAFTKAVAEAKKKMQQTRAAHLMPPNQRTKSRFLNIDILAQWSMDALSILVKEEHPDKELLKEYCEWLLNYKELIGYLSQLDLINKNVREHIRDYGLSSNTGAYIETLLEEAMKSKVFNFKACEYAGRLIDFFIEHSKIVPLDEVWIGSSEIIESLFGKLKVLERDQHKGGFTSLVLGMAACTGKLDSSIIGNAMLETKENDVKEWAKAQIGQSFLSKRRESLSGWRRKRKKSKKLKEKFSEKTYQENGQELAGAHCEMVSGL